MSIISFSIDKMPNTLVYAVDSVMVNCTYLVVSVTTAYCQQGNYLDCLH